ncbi:MAG TPA: neutral zinc metallopeptidase [Thermomonospora sp.]|nr:neutral zinc metallopeptidase [Thermomonospora sp.]
MHIPRLPLAALALGGALLTATGCSIRLGSTGEVGATSRPTAPATAPGQGPGTAGAAATPTPGTGGTGGTGTGGPAQGTPINEAEFQRDITGAPQIIDGYWRTHWSEFFTGTYRSPRVHGGYDGDDLSTAPTCAGQPASRNNAFYCIPEDYIAWDDNLMRTGYAQGDAWVYLVIAHEWGHAIQNRLRMNHVARATELQADCLAGAALYGARRDGTLLFEDGDVKELSNGLVAVGDDTEWTNPQDHGDPIERITAFGKGRDGGVRACIPDTPTP